MRLEKTNADVSATNEMQFFLFNLTHIASCVKVTISSSFPGLTDKFTFCVRRDEVCGLSHKL